MRVKAGFIPLVDCAGLVVAEVMGFAQSEGLQLELTREASWATLRDKLAIGAIDAAHLLAPMAIASKLAIGYSKPPVAALMGLSMNGNAISVSNPLFEAMAATGLFAGPHDIAGKAKALAAVIAGRAAAGKAPLTFAVVYPFSAHNYELRYLLGAGGVDPDRDVELVVVPPPYIVDHLRSGLIDGFCVGAPWTLVGAREGLARVIATKSQIWRFGPEKVLGMRERDVDADPDVAHRLIRAVQRALAWSSAPDNHGALAHILAQPDYLDLDAELIANTLAGRVAIDDGADDPRPNFILFDRDLAGPPRRAHALWFYSQMVRWGQAPHTPANLRLAASAYRPDIYRAALADTDLAAAASDAADRALPEGDAFFDGRRFDPDDVAAYVAGFDQRAASALDPAR